MERMLRPDSELGSSAKEAHFKRNMISMSLRNIGSEILKACEDRGGQCLLLTTPTVVTITLWTTDKMVQIVSVPSGRQDNGQFKATAKELDPEKFWLARHLPYEKRPAPGEENAALEKPPVFDGIATEDSLKKAVQQAFASVFD